MANGCEQVEHDKRLGSVDGSDVLLKTPFGGVGGGS